MKKVKKSIDMILCNLGTLAGFELFYKAITFVIFSPLFVKLFDFIMKATGYSYLTYENIMMNLSDAGFGGGTGTGQTLFWFCALLCGAMRLPFVFGEDAG